MMIHSAETCSTVWGAFKCCVYLQNFICTLNEVFSTLTEVFHTLTEVFLYPD